MFLDDALEYEPTHAEASRELDRHGNDWTEFTAYCAEFGLNWSDAGVLLGFLGY